MVQDRVTKGQVKWVLSFLSSHRLDHLGEEDLLEAGTLEVMALATFHREGPQADHLSFDHHLVDHPLAEAQAEADLAEADLADHHLAVAAAAAEA